MCISHPPITYNRTLHIAIPTVKKGQTRTKNDLLMYAFILVISTVLSNVYLMTQVKNNRFTKVDVSIKDSFSHFKPMMLLFVPILAMTFYHQINFFANIILIQLYGGIGAAICFTLKKESTVPSSKAVFCKEM